MDQCYKRKKVTFEIVCAIFSVSPEPGNHRPSFCDIKRIKTAMDTANRCSADSTLNAKPIAENEFIEYTGSASVVKWYVYISY